MSVPLSDDEHEPAERSLRDRLRICQQEGLPGIPVHELLRYIREVAEGLDALHSQSSLYRDVKPENILLLNGHARLAESGMVHPPLDKPGSGTPAYMAPEAWRKQANSGQSDQYSLAISYAEMRLGRRLISGQDMMAVMYEHLYVTPDLSPLPEQQVLRKALAKVPEQRYPSCLGFVQALERMAVP